MKYPLSAFLSLSCLIAGLHAPCQASSPTSFYSISEVVSGWSSQQHLWVKGPLGVSEEKLAQLEAWLDDQAPNWTIVLMETAAGQRFDKYRGMAAVEHALGQGLSNQTPFGDLIDNRTGQANGATFVLFLKERKFSYFASEVFDSRKLGERYWVGQLDRPAIQAMRSGGRMVDAVKDTISHIEGELSRQLKEEAEQRRLAAIREQKAIAEARFYPDQLRSLIAEADGRATQLRGQYVGLVGPMVRPPLSLWQGEVESITRLARDGDYHNARKHFTDTQNGIQNFHSNLDRWLADRKRFETLNLKVEAHPSPDKAPAVSGHLAQAAQALKSAQINHAAGIPLYRDQFDTAVESYARAERRFGDWQKAEGQRKQLIRAAIALFGLILLVLSGLANRLRGPVKREAHHLFSSWQEKLAGKFDQLFTLMDRTGLLVGNRHDADKLDYSGTTEALARQTIRGVDELFIMSAATDKVMDEVKSLVFPTSPWGKVLNTFSRRNYQQAIDLLSAAPIGFDQHDHIEAILNHPDSPSPRTLLGQSADYAPFRISFQNLIESYDERQSEALRGIIRLENGIDGCPMSQQRLQAALDQTSDSAESLANSAEEDQFFPLETVRLSLVPAAQTALDKTAEVGERDPVEAFESLIPESDRIVSEAGVIIETLLSFRETDLPNIRESLSGLTEQKRQTRWVASELSQLSNRCETLGGQATSVSIATAWSEFADSLTRLKGRTLSCLRLTGRIADEILRLRRF